MSCSIIWIAIRTSKAYETFWQLKTILHCSQKVSFKLLKFADIVVFASELTSHVKRMFYPTVAALSFVPHRLDLVAKIVEIPLFVLVLPGKRGTSESHDTCVMLKLSRQNPPTQPRVYELSVGLSWPNRDWKLFQLLKSYKLFAYKHQIYFDSFCFLYLNFGNLRFFWFAVCDAAAHKDCIPKTSACRASPGFHGQFSGTSPFRPHMAARNPFSKQTSSPIPPKLSPDLAKHRKVSAPARIRQGTFTPSFENRSYSRTPFKRPPSGKWEVAAW